ncbi:hypothetical protein Tco_1474622 [Tanacetum coccineum]
MKCLQSPKYVAALGATIGLAIDKGMQTGLIVGINHGKAGRGLSEVAAYDPSVEERYVASVLTLWSFCWNSRDQPVTAAYKQLLLPSNQKEDNAVIEEISLSDSLIVVHDRVLKVKESALSHRLSISEAMGPLVDPLSSENLVGETSTSSRCLYQWLIMKCWMRNLRQKLLIPQRLSLKRKSWTLHRITL